MDLSQLSLGTAAVLVFGAIASLAMLRGLLKIFWSTLVLCVAGLAGFLAWQHAPAAIARVTENPPDWAVPAAAAGAFVLALLLLRILARFVADPLRTSDPEAAERNRRSPVRWIFTLIFSLVPTALLWFGGATLLRHLGSIAELQEFARQEKSEPVDAATAFLARLKPAIESAIPADWFRLIDSTSDDQRLALAKLISVADSPPPKAIPVLEETDIRHIVLGDPELRRLAREGRYAEILRDPRLDRLLENDNLRQVLTGLDL